jgi:hypothetical protein
LCRPPEEAESAFPLAEAETIAEPGSARIGDLAAYWRRKSAGRMAPRRCDIDPAEIREHMPYLFMVDVLPEGEYRYRLVGSELVERLGRNPTGRILSELHAERPRVYQLLKARFDQVVAAKGPVYSRGKVYWLDGDDLRRFECGYFPLSEDGKNVSIILAELVILWPRQA